MEVEHNCILNVGGQLYGLAYSDEEHLLFISMGRALAEIQQFESTLMFTLSAMIDKEDEKKSFELAMDKNANKTLGQIARMIEQRLNHPDLAAQLLAIRDKRNFIVHGFLRHYGWGPFMSSEKYREAAEELERFQEELRAFHEPFAKQVVMEGLAEIGMGAIDKEGNLELFASNVP